MTSAVDPTKKQTTEHYAANDQEVTYFAQTNFRGDSRRFGIKLDDRRRHMYMIGKTGMGKSTLLENMIIQDIQNGKGLAVVDPHGDLVEKVINYIPSHRVNDVIYFNPSDMDHPIAFNILEQVSAEYKNLVSNGLVGVFKKIWADSWGPRLEYILINSILALLEHPGSTLLGVTRMLVDSQYRKRVLKSVKDPVVKAFWITEYNNYSEKFRNEAISPIQNKVGQFLSSSLIRNIVGQTKSTINMREIMDSGKILLMNLSKGRIGEENAALLGAMMITKIQLAAMSRVDITEKERRDFFLYVDEFQNFSTEAFAGILSEARKYRLDLIMAHQYIEQLSDEVRAAVFGNVGTLIAFRVGATDAEALEMEFQPTFMQEHCVTLPSFHIYLRLMIDGVASEPFSATTLPPVSGENNNAATVISTSRERYARNRVVVEEKIARWAGVMEDAESGKFIEDDENDSGDTVQTSDSSSVVSSETSAADTHAPTPTPRPTPALVRIHPDDIPRPPQPQQQGVSSTAPQHDLNHFRSKGISFVRGTPVRPVKASVAESTPAAASTSQRITPVIPPAVTAVAATHKRMVASLAKPVPAVLSNDVAKNAESTPAAPVVFVAPVTQQQPSGAVPAVESASKKRKRRRRKKKQGGDATQQPQPQSVQQQPQRPPRQKEEQPRSQQPASTVKQQPVQQQPKQQRERRPQPAPQSVQSIPQGSGSKDTAQQRPQNTQPSHSRPAQRPIPQQSQRPVPSPAQPASQPTSTPDAHRHTLQPGQSIKL